MYDKTTYSICMEIITASTTQVLQQENVTQMMQVELNCTNFQSANSLKLEKHCESADLHQAAHYPHSTPDESWVHYDIF